MGEAELRSQDVGSEEEITTKLPAAGQKEGSPLVKQMFT